jgi:uncharacterized lipoprotein YddW (UPF0748 family)
MMHKKIIAACWLMLASVLMAQPYRPVKENIPAVTREFRGAWAAVIYNIDWPSKSTLSAAAQKAEMVAILNRMVELRMNALIFQVRPQCDAVYESSREPWSSWLTGTMGTSPGYDPLAFTVAEAHRRGIEVHAWFNPFRAQANAATPVAPNHISRSAPNLTKQYATMKWCDPAIPETRTRALAAMLDVARRYDVDGIHIDDYFYPYPIGGARFADGKTNAERRALVDQFVQQMYAQLKQVKPWLRIGISPFGIWKPGIPEGTTAQLNAYEDLACDARKWLANGWCDYMAPQLYWRIEGPQSYPLLLKWWRAQGSRPVWPGIATSRLSSSEDPTRKAEEIYNQVMLSRTIPGSQHPGHLHWSVKALMENRDNVNALLKKAYGTGALVPPLAGASRISPAMPEASARAEGKETKISWKHRDPAIKKTILQARYQGKWFTYQVLGPQEQTVSIPFAEAVAISSADRFGTTSAPRILAR